MCQLQVAWCRTLAATSFQHAAPLQHVALCCVSETQATSVVSGPLGVFGSNGWVAGCKRVKWAGNYCHPCASTTKWWTYASTSTPSSRRSWWEKNMEWEGTIKNHLCDVQFCAVFASFVFHLDIPFDCQTRLPRLGYFARMARTVRWFQPLFLPQEKPDNQLNICLALWSRF